MIKRTLSILLTSQLVASTALAQVTYPVPFPTNIGGTGVTQAQGNGSKVQLSTGTTTTNDCVKYDSNGNTVDAGAACGSGGGGDTITSPNSTITVGGTSSASTVDFNLANANRWTGWQSGTPVTLTISTSTFTPTNSGQNYAITLVHAACPCTLANPSTTPVPGTSGMYIITQSSTGSDLITTWGSDYVYAGGTASITLSTGANAVDYIPYYVTSSSVIVLGGLIKGPVH